MANIDEDDQVEVIVEAKLHCPRDVNVELLKKKIKAAFTPITDVDEIEELNVFTT